MGLNVIIFVADICRLRIQETVGRICHTSNVEGCDEKDFRIGVNFVPYDSEMKRLVGVSVQGVGVVSIVRVYGNDIDILFPHRMIYISKNFRHNI